MATYYYICSYHHSTIGRWQKARATTLSSAKREATNQFGGDYPDSELRVAVGDNINEDRVIVARRKLTDKKWQDLV